MKVLGMDAAVSGAVFGCDSDAPTPLELNSINVSLYYTESLRDLDFMGKLSVEKWMICYINSLEIKV